MLPNLVGSAYNFVSLRYSLNVRKSPSRIKEINCNNAQICSEILDV